MDANPDRKLNEKESELLRQILNQARVRNDRILSQMTSVKEKQVSLVNLIGTFSAAMSDDGVLDLNNDTDIETFRSVIGRHPLSAVESIYNKVLAKK